MNSEQLKIKPATIFDYSKIAKIYNQYIEAGGVTMDEQIKNAGHIAKWVGSFHELEKMFVLKKNNSVIGWGMIKKYSNRSGYRTTCETAIYLTAEERGKGYGTHLKQYLLKTCKDLGYHHIVAKITTDNLASIEYNKKLGYTIVGVQKEVGYRDNRWYDMVIMQYLIREGGEPRI